MIRAGENIGGHMSSGVVPPHIGAVILHWNTEDATRRCLQAILENSLRPYFICVYDNGSSPESLNRLRSDFPDVTFKGDGKNVGYAAGVNRGIREALSRGCDTVLLVNSDAFLSRNAIETMVQTKADIVNPLILAATDSEEIWFNGGEVSFSGRGTHPGLHRRRVPGREEAAIAPITFATGCAMMIQRTTLERIGFLDEALYSYSEDLDFCLRAVAQGLTIVINRTARASHLESHSVKANVGREFRDYYVLRNRLLILRKHFRHRWYWLRVSIVVVWEYAGRALPFLLLGRWRRVAALSRGLVDGLMGRSGKRFRETLPREESHVRG